MFLGFSGLSWGHCELLVISFGPLAFPFFWAGENKHFYGSHAHPSFGETTCSFSLC